MKKRMSGCGTDGRLEKFPSFQFFYALLLVFFSAAICSEKSYCAPIQIPDPVGIFLEINPVEVARGNAVQIHMVVSDKRKRQPFSGAPKEFNFHITTRPRHGKLSSVVQFSRSPQQDSATVVYLTSPDSLSESDGFEIAVTEAGNEEPILRRMINVRIFQPQLTVSPQMTLKFPQSFPGVVTRAMLVLKNSGHATWEGVLTTEPPFSFLGETRCLIEPGQQQKITCLFSPSRVGTFDAPVFFSSKNNDWGGLISYTMHGESQPPFSVQSSEVDFGKITVGETARKPFTITNNSTTQTSVTIEMNPPFASTKKLALLPRERKEFDVEMNTNQPGEFAGKLRAFNEHVERVALLRGTVLRAAGLQMEHAEELAFGRGFISAFPRTNTVQVSNPGDRPWAGRIECPKPFFISRQSLGLNGGESAKIEIVFAPEIAGVYTNQIVFAGTTTNRYQLSGRVVEGHSIFEEGSAQTPLSKLPESEAKPDGPPTVKRDVALTRLDSETVRLAWSSIEVEDPRHFAIAQRVVAPVLISGDIHYTWVEMNDLVCKKEPPNHFTVDIDRLRPDWVYFFSIRRVDGNGQVINQSETITLRTPPLRPVEDAFQQAGPWLYGLLGLMAAACLGWFLYRFNDWFGSNL